jgi:hypothetical protein
VKPLKEKLIFVWKCFLNRDSMYIHIKNSNQYFPISIPSKLMLSKNYRGHSFLKKTFDMHKPIQKCALQKWKSNWLTVCPLTKFGAVKVLRPKAGSKNIFVFGWIWQFGCSAHATCFEVNRFFKEVARGGEQTRALSIPFILSFFTTLALGHSGSPLWS